MNRDLGGVGYYCYRLMEYLQTCSPKHDYIMLYNKSKLKTMGFINAKEQKISYPYRNLYRLFGPRLFYRIPVEMFLGSFDIYHGTGYVSLPTHRAKVVVTVHDLVSKYYPETLTPQNLRFQEHDIPYHVRASDRIIAVSESTKRDLVNFLQVDPDKIDVTYLAADEIFHPLPADDSKCEEIRCKYQLPQRYVLHVGNLNARKNLIATVRAFQQVCRAGCEENLVFVGGKGNGYDELVQEIQRLGLTDRVQFVGYTEREDLPYLYNLATFFIHVSKLEGFGLPVLEAMQCGTPVLVSNVSALPEVVGKAGLQVDPNDIEQIADCWERILQDKKLWQNLSELGLKQAENFSWNKMARDTVAVYEKALRL